MQPIIQSTIKYGVILKLDWIVKMVNLKIQMNAAITVITFLPNTQIGAVSELLWICTAQFIYLRVVRTYEPKAKNVIIGALNCKIRIVTIILEQYGFQ